jgi:hypothetical protein
MAKEKAKKEVNRSEFIRTALTKNPDLDLKQINLLWAKAGHTGEISNPLFYQVRAKLGIRTECVWVQEGGPETTESLEPEPEREDHRNDDLVEAAENYLPHILMFYKRFEKKRPLMLLDLKSQKIYAYPYKEFKAELGERSQRMLAADYEKAIAKNKIVVFVRDDENRRLASMLFDYE